MGFRTGVRLPPPPFMYERSRTLRNEVKLVGEGFGYVVVVSN